MDEASRLARLRDTHGYRPFKVRVGRVCGHDQDEWPGRTEELVPTVRRAIGDDLAPLADGNSCYTPPRVIQVGRMLEDNGVCHFEEPCPYWELEWTVHAAAGLATPVAGGEGDNDLAQWQRMVCTRAVDVLQPDVYYVCGIARARRVAALAAEARLPCVPHSANRSMATVFTLHLPAAIPNAGPCVEFFIELADWTRSLFAPALEAQDGRVPIPEGPGWGVTVNAARLSAAEGCVSEAR